MPRKIKELSEYCNVPKELLNEKEFNISVSTDDLDFICGECNTTVNSKKRLIVARILKNQPLLCDSCKNKRSRRK